MKPSILAPIAALAAASRVAADCLVGDIMHREGDSIGYIGLECLNGTHFDARSSTCGPNGEILDTEIVLSCYETVPHCVQCGDRGWGAALCLSVPDAGDRDCGDDDGEGEDGEDGGSAEIVPEMLGPDEGEDGEGEDVEDGSGVEIVPETMGPDKNDGGEGENGEDGSSSTTAHDNYCCGALASAQQLRSSPPEQSQTSACPHDMFSVHGATYQARESSYQICCSSDDRSPGEFVDAVLSACEELPIVTPSDSNGASEIKESNENENLPSDTNSNVDESEVDEVGEPSGASITERAIGICLAAIGVAFQAVL